MGFYGDHVLPRVINAACGTESLEPLRRRVCSGLTGAVLEIGFGSGLNVPFYPPAVRSVVAVEPTGLAWRLAADRVRASRVEVVRRGLDGESLPFGDASFDAALSTWTLCTIPDVHRAMVEIGRVLKANGRLHFLEHGRAPDESVRRWQRRAEPLQKRLFGGCHLTRSIPDLLTDAGFTIVELDRFYSEDGPKFSGATTLGWATGPSEPGQIGPVR